MFKSIIVSTVACVGIVGLTFAQSESSLSVIRTGGSATPVSSEVTSYVTTTKVSTKQENVPVYVRGTPGTGGIGYVKSIETDPTFFDYTSYTSTDTETGARVGLDVVIKQEMSAQEEEMPTSGVGITESYPNRGLAHTGAIPRNALYLLISLCGAFGLVWVMRKENY